MEENNLEIISWQKAKTDLNKVNTKFAQQIDSISPPKDYKIIKARYKFGDHIVKEGVLHLPYKNKLYPFNSSKLPSEIRNDFFPIGVPINKVIERFYQTSKQIFPLKIFNPGEIFSLWQDLPVNDVFIRDRRYWNIVAGCRSLYLLSRINNDRSFNKLKNEFSLRNRKPYNLSDQHELFKNINNSQTKDSWSIDILFFPKKWFDDKENRFSHIIKLFLYEVASNNIYFFKNLPKFQFEISSLISKNNLKPNPYISDTLSHLYAIRNGIHPSFFVSNDDNSGPINFLQETISSIYNPSKAPIFIEANHLGLTNAHNSYYSFTIPTLTKFYPKSRKTNKATNILKLQNLLQKIILYKKHNQHDISYEYVDKWISNTKYEFIHTDKFNCESFLSNIELQINDHRIMDNLNKYPSLEFPSTESFFRGCVKITAEPNISLDS